MKGCCCEASAPSGRIRQRAHAAGGVVCAGLSLRQAGGCRLQFKLVRRILCITIPPWKLREVIHPPSLGGSQD